MSHNTLENFYKTLFSMVHHHPYSIADIEGMICYELDIFVAMIKDHMAVVAEKQEQLRLANEALQRRKF